MRRGFSELAPRAVMLAVIVLGLSACGGSSAPDDAPGGGPVAPQTQTIYSVANACWLLQSEAGFVSADTAAADYGLTPDRAQATAFYFKPTATGKTRAPSA
jgi:hypothetical protein